jgi:hypothetical protein
MLLGSFVEAWLGLGQLRFLRDRWHIFLLTLVLLGMALR